MQPRRKGQAGTLFLQQSKQIPGVASKEAPVLSLRDDVAFLDAVATRKTASILLRALAAASSTFFGVRSGSDVCLLRIVDFGSHPADGPLSISANPQKNGQMAFVPFSPVGWKSGAPPRFGPVATLV